LSSAKASARDTASSARSASWTCSVSAVKGVRNSCAASAMNSRCASSARCEANQQVVQRPDQRHHLGRHAAFGQGIERDGGARGHRPRDVVERSQAAADDNPDQHPEHRQHEQERRHGAPGGRKRQMVAHLHRLRHLDHLASLLHAENTPLATAAFDRCKADRCLVGKLLARVREIDACTIRAPDLDREILRVFVDPEFMLRPVLESIVARDSANWRSW
jgi:hypothetical protein